jgi:hypothetical protein
MNDKDNTTHNAHTWPPEPLSPLLSRQETYSGGTVIESGLILGGGSIAVQGSGMLCVSAGTLDVDVHDLTGDKQMPAEGEKSE